MSKEEKIYYKSVLIFVFSIFIIGFVVTIGANTENNKLAAKFVCNNHGETVYDIKNDHIFCHNKEQGKINKYFVKLNLGVQEAVCSSLNNGFAFRESWDNYGIKFFCKTEKKNYLCYENTFYSKEPRCKDIGSNPDYEYIKYFGRD